MHFACGAVVHELIKETARYTSVRVGGLLTTLVARSSEAVLPDLLSHIMPYSTTAVTNSTPQIIQKSMVKVFSACHSKTIHR